MKTENIKVNSIGIVGSDVLMLLEDDTKVKAINATVNMSWEDLWQKPIMIPSRVTYQKAIVKRKIIIEIEFEECKITQNQKLEEAIK